MAFTSTTEGPGLTRLVDTFSKHHPDCEIVPVLFYVAIMGPVFGRGGLMAGHPKVQAYWDRIKPHPVATKVLGELSQALDHFQKTGQPI